MTENEGKTPKLATRRNRFFAFWIDMLIISFVIRMSALALGDFYARLGGWGRVLDYIGVGWRDEVFDMENAQLSFDDVDNEEET